MKNLNDIPTPQEVETPLWGNAPIGSQEHKAWLFNTMIKEIAKCLSREDVRTQFAMRRKYYSFPTTLNVHINSEERDVSLILNGLKSVMKQRGWTIELSDTTNYDGKHLGPSLFVWPSDMELSSPHYENIMKNRLPNAS